MARATYLAPGVYVEEVPSAQQLIAGVGTNTVGFIGIVDDEITCPEPNPHYDPVLAELALKVAAIVGEGKEAASKEAIATIDTEIKAREAEIDTLNKDIAGWQKKLDEVAPEVAKLETDIGALEGREDADKTDLSNKRRESLRRRREIDVLSGKISQGKEDLVSKQETIDGLNASKEGKAAASDGATTSALRPYVLKKVKVMADPCDTKLCTNFSEYTSRFGSFSAYKDKPEEPHDPDNPSKWKYKPMHWGHSALTHAVYGFFKNGGTRCFVARLGPNYSPGDIQRAQTAFESIDEIAIIAAPGVEAKPEVWDMLVSHCERCEDRFAILDCQEEVEDADGFLDVERLTYTSHESVLPSRNKNAAFYFPYIEVLDPAKQLQDRDPARRVDLKYRGRAYVPPSGHIAGIYARTDEQRGVHKAPANTTVLGALEVKYYISKPKQELLNPQGVNCIRLLNGNVTVWGARTVGGDANGEWKYINVRRLFLFVAESINDGTQWVVFEPNDPALWGKIKRNVSDFLTNVWRNGALFGLTPQEAFYVKCDEETNPPEERELGKVVTEIGIAIVRPAEFVIFRLMQTVGKTSG
ncbi:MAG: phage tail sheath C-terminal domain-containing protein [Gammaproteobacteria bacterium]